MLCRFVTTPIEIDLARKEIGQYIIFSVECNHMLLGLIKFAFRVAWRMVLLQTHLAFRVVFTLVPGVICVPAVGAHNFFLMFRLPIVKKRHFSPAQ